MGRVRVLVIEDMPLARQVLGAALARDPEIEVVGFAGDTRLARQKLERTPVDVITLDVELPGTSGLSFLRGLLAARPLPVLMVSSFTQVGSEAALRALELGAVDVVAKPDRSLEQVGEQFAAELVEKVKAAARVRVRPRLEARKAEAPLLKARLPSALARPGWEGPVLLLGASTGGCEALPELLRALPADAPPVVCVQHIPAVFSRSFAARLDELLPLHVTEARAGDVLEPGHVYLAPGGRHLLFAQRGPLALELSDEPPLKHHRPAIDLAFSSAAQRLGRRAVAALLTGMGADGARGLLELRQAGAATFAQDEASSLVYGMPREAVKLGAAAQVAPLSQLGARMLDEARRRRKP